MKLDKVVGKLIADIGAIKSRLDSLAGIRAVVHNGQNGVDGKDGINPDVDEVAALAAELIRVPEDGVDGQTGQDGIDGQNGVNGQAGSDGVNGQAGSDGQDGRDGVDGKDGEDGQPGRDGVDGVDGASVTTLELIKNELFATIDGIRESIGKIELPKTRNGPFVPKDTSAGGGGGRLGHFLSKITGITQSVLSDVIFAGEVTARKFITNPASLQVGSNDLVQAGIHFQINAEIDNSTRFMIDREYDDTGSFDVFSEKLGILQQIDLLPFTGTRFTFTTGLQLSGGAAPGVNAYQIALQLFIYEEIINFNLNARIGGFDGTLVTTVTDFNAPAPPEFNITNITQSNPAVVTAPGHTYVTGQRIGTGGIDTGMTEINDLVSDITVSGDEVTFTGIDSTSFSPYVSGGTTRGGLVTIPLDNPNRVNPSNIFFTTITVDKPFDLDGTEVVPGFFLPWNPIFGQDIDALEKLLTDLNVAVEPNTFFVSKGGNDTYSGKSVVQPFATIAVSSAALALETPSQGNQFSLTSNALDSYDETGFPVDLGDWVRLHMPQSSFSGSATSGASVVKASSFVGSEAYSITAVNIGQVGLLFDGTISSGFEAKAVMSTSTGAAISIINSAADSFPEIGYVAGVVTAVNIDTDTTTTTHCTANIIELLADNAIGVNINAPNGPVVLKGDVIRMADGVTAGKSINVDGSLLTAIDYETIEPDMFFNAGKSSLTSQLVTGDINVAMGAVLTVDVLEHDGAVINAGKINGNIAGVDYGTYIDIDDILATFFRAGAIGTTFQENGRLTIDTTTDTINSITASYLQTISVGIDVTCEVFDADTLDIYFQSTSTESTIGTHFFDVVATATPLPTDQVVNLIVTFKRTGSAGVNGAGCNIGFVRLTPP